MVGGRKKRWEEGGRAEDELPACLLPQQQVWPTSFAGLKNTNTHTMDAIQCGRELSGCIDKNRRRSLVLQTLMTTSSHGVLRPTPWTKSRQKEVLRVFLLDISKSPLQRYLEISISHSRNLLQFLQCVIVHCKGERRKTR